jgi:hypothetical protein
MGTPHVEGIVCYVKEGIGVLARAEPPLDITLRVQNLMLESGREKIVVVCVNLHRIILPRITAIVK